MIYLFFFLSQNIVKKVVEGELLPEDEQWNVFANIKEILEFNEVLYKELEERVNTSMEHPETKLSDLFLSRVS